MTGATDGIGKEYARAVSSEALFLPSEIHQSFCESFIDDSITEGSRVVGW